MSKKKQKSNTKITIEDFIKAVKKADREEELAQQAGWTRKTSIHKNKKLYDRKRDKNSHSEE